MPARTHGDTLSTEFKSWVGMRDRCNNKNGKLYKYYGGRGIRVCERWNEYTNFLSDIGRKPSPAHSLDRINNDGDYDPLNCRWATKKEQANNRRSNTFVTIDDRLLTLTEAARELGIPHSTASVRNARGLSIKG